MLAYMIIPLKPLMYKAFRLYRSTILSYAPNVYVMAIHVKRLTVICESLPAAMIAVIFPARGTRPKADVPLTPDQGPLHVPVDGKEVACRFIHNRDYTVQRTVPEALRIIPTVMLLRQAGN